MAEQPIARSYLGILRVTGIYEKLDGQLDEFFNPYYYGSPEGLVSNQGGNEDGFYPDKTSAKTHFDGGSVRYSFPDDPYRHKKIPVTDSQGFYLNFNVGEDSITIGSDETNNGTDASTTSFTQLLAPGTFNQDTVFPVFNAKRTVIGREERVMPENKNLEFQVQGGKVNIDSSPYYNSIKAKLVTNNIFDHTAANINNGVYQKVSDGYARKTTIQATEPNIRNYDALVHYQDNIDWTNYSKNKTYDSIVDIVNLKDYVKEKINKWLGNNTVEVPTGIVQWQYINLKKWYNYGNSVWSGNYPPMGNMYDTNSYTPSLYQGVVRKGLNHLAATTQVVDEETGDIVDKQLKEIIPIYKRDYVLCDGKEYTIFLHTPRTFDRYNYVSYEMFINLFFAIGYEYTDYENIAPHRRNVKSNDIYSWEKLGEGYAIQDTKIDKDVLFGVDMITMLAYQMLQKEYDAAWAGEATNSSIIDTNGKYNRANAQNWLMKQKLPEEYIFNTPIPVSLNANGTEVANNNTGMLFTYTTAENKTIKYDVGREVTTFSSLIRYYDNTSKSYVNVEAYKIAEVQFILDLFAEVALNQDRLLSQFCFYNFQVPNFMQSKDEKYDTGVFIGSSPYYWDESMKGQTAGYSYSAFSDASVPHRHVIFMGPKVFYGNGTGRDPYRSPMGTIDQINLARAENAEFYMDALPNQAAYSANINSYSFAEVANTYYSTEMRGGMSTYVIQMKNGTTDITYPDHPDPRWRDAEPNRGATSEMILVTVDGKANQVHDEKYLQAQTQTQGGLVEYFTPESSSLVPLIKI